MAAQKHDGRNTQAKKGGRENVITKGAIETANEAFHGGSVLHDPPFKSTYGDHKKMGSEGVPVKKAGRSGPEFFQKKLYPGGKK